MKEENVNQQGMRIFVVPHSVMFSEELSNSAKILLSVLITDMDYTGNVTTTPDELANLFGWKKERVLRIIRTLKAKGFVKSWKDRDRKGFASKGIVYLSY
jgi:transcription initiation factor IIE alpha subunit